MPDAEGMLEFIAASRAQDPLAPVTVIAPSHAAALQLRRRLAERGPFAAVRFEPLARIAELIAAGALAAQGRTPLARPIGDYVAEEVARESRGTLAGVSDLPGYARVLRRLFQRLRRGGIRTPSDIQEARMGHLPEVVRLFGRFRERTAAFYDAEDLLDAAAETVRSGRAGIMDELGSVYVFPSTVRSAGGASFIEVLREVALCTVVDETASAPKQRFVLAPDAASEVREAVREIVSALQEGAELHEVAVLHGADPAYPRMLREAFDLASVPPVGLPGTPLIETVAGQAVLGLVELPEREYSRAATMDALGIAPLRRMLPGPDGTAVAARNTAWDRLSREAGITRGIARWNSGLSVFIAERNAKLDAGDDSEYEGRRRAIEFEVEQAGGLRAVIDELARRLEPLRAAQPADEFIATLKKFVQDYFQREAEGLDAVLDEIDQLGTVAAVGGTFTLGQFARALRANLEAAHTRARKLGDGVLVADYRAADGMRFKHVVLCGAREGALPAGPGEDALLEDRVWSRLRETHPYIEDAALRIERARLAADRAIAAGAETLTWCAPLYEASGTREYYPSPLMVGAAQASDPAIRSGSDLRRHGPATWLRRGASPLALRLMGPPVDAAEVRLREAVLARQQHTRIDAAHPRWPAVAMWRARGGLEFSAWDGNVAELAREQPLHVTGRVSPTSLEAYGSCGFKYFCRSVLRLRAVEEPEEREMMDAATRGTLVHGTLEAFFREQQARGRPQLGEEWKDTDRARLFEILDAQLEAAEARGQRGMDVFADHERRTLRADLAEFLEADNEYRLETGAIPSEFEVAIPETEIAGVRLRGYADRIDRSADGRQAWVMDYKTGSAEEFKGIDADPLLGGTKLQLPAYLLAVPDAEDATAFYWFISRRGGFERVAYARTAEAEQRFRETVTAIVDGIAAGAFPASPGEYDEFYNGFKNCKYCDFDRMCPRRRDDAFGEKAGDASMHPWLLVERTAKGEG
ncbi:MAG: PD-(D/E)XK nuclease family protein [Chloroflexi bacterium]|nr:PD-(D/E)XK nuclease family protein [Chloroflexota bacterium]